ncbi:MAG: D-glycero-beta-D-manno-heptose 1,7-bisphosphate 7-phosphatase [Calditrichaeota bacterium]|nr:MAG: D-glycero-beta-D-manno-heptose 1,7-bisphosphate 7-phosphatase [Calditrichota bacterium]
MKHSTGKNRAVFLDRDGTLNEDVHFLDSVENLRLIPGAIEAVRIFNQLNMKVVVVSNQSGIARGYFDEDTVKEIHQAMAQRFLQSGARIDAFYYCPHHPEYGNPPYQQQCYCRKPNPGMLLSAAEELDIGFPSSYMVGDKLSDIETGKRVNLFTILVLTGKGSVEAKRMQSDLTLPQADVVVQDILEAARFISEREQVSHS